MSVLGRVAVMVALPNLVFVNVSSPVLESTATMSASELVYSIRLDKLVLSSLFVAVAVGVVKPSSVPLVNVNVLPELAPKVVVVVVVVGADDNSLKSSIQTDFLSAVINDVILILTLLTGFLIIGMKC